MFVVLNGALLNTYSNCCFAFVKKLKLLMSSNEIENVKKKLNEYQQIMIENLRSDVKF